MFKKFVDKIITGFVSAGQNMGDARALYTDLIRQPGRSQLVSIQKLQQPFLHNKNMWVYTQM
jgi:hypothetical protein